jgi:hypothetical protein
MTRTAQIARGRSSHAGAGAVSDPYLEDHTHSLAACDENDAFLQVVVEKRVIGEICGTGSCTGDGTGLRSFTVLYLKKLYPQMDAD